MTTEIKIDLWLPNNKNRLKTVLLGNVPTSKNLKDILSRPIPKVIEKMLDETHEDLTKIKNKYELVPILYFCLKINIFNIKNKTKPSNIASYS